MFHSYGCSRFLKLNINTISQSCHFPPETFEYCFTSFFLDDGSYLRMLQSSPFIVALVVAQHILSFTRPLTQALQQTDCYIIMACNDANRCKTVIQKERSSPWKSNCQL
jgi:hypothetical protein